MKNFFSTGNMVIVALTVVGVMIAFMLMKSIDKERESGEKYFRNT